MLRPANIMFTGLSWRSRWDSNPRALADKRFSRPPRYDHFDTAPCAVRFHPNGNLVYINQLRISTQQRDQPVQVIVVLIFDYDLALSYAAV